VELGPLVSVEGNKSFKQGGKIQVLAAPSLVERTLAIENSKGRKAKGARHLTLRSWEVTDPGVLGNSARRKGEGEVFS